MDYLSPDDVDFESMRSGGPGGQHGDRRATAVRLRVEINDIPVADEQRDFLRDHLPPRHRTKDNELIVENSDSRSQKRNRENALRQANEVIEQAIEEGQHQREAEKRKKRSEKRKSGGGGGEKDIKEEQRKRRRSETTDDLIEEAFEEDPDTMERYVEENDDE